jgi:phosphoglycolate phosphatase-like HAD superfamily hydrolase
LIDLKIGTNVITNIDTVILEKDGVLFDPHIWWSEIVNRRAWALVLCYDLLYEEAEKLRYLMGWRPGNIMSSEGPTGLVAEKEVIWEVRKYLNTHLGITTINNEIEDIFSKVREEFKKDAHNFTRVTRHAFDFVSALYVRAVKISIVTNDYVDATRKELQYATMSHMIPVIIGHESCRTTKETGGPALQAMLRTDSTFESTVIIGSTPNDMKMAVASSVAAGIAVGTGQVGRLDLLKYTPYLAFDLSDISISPSGGK